MTAFQGNFCQITSSLAPHLLEEKESGIKISGLTPGIFIHALIILLLFIITPSSGQIPGSLDATKKDAIYTTYAAPLTRSSYKTDQAYQFLWNDNENAPEFVSKDGLNIGLAFENGHQAIFRTGELYREPVITTSYSDLVKYYYYPFRNIRVEVLFDVYSSQEAFMDISIKNEGVFPEEMKLIPYLYCQAGGTLNDIVHQDPFDFYTFSVDKKRDDWMREHSIPFTEKLRGCFGSETRFDSVKTFTATGHHGTTEPSPDLLTEMKQQFMWNKRSSDAIKGILGYRSFRIYPGDRVHFRMIFGMEDAGMRIPDQYRKLQPLFAVDTAQVIREDEKVYKRVAAMTPAAIQIPEENGISAKDCRLFFQSCFNLLRQCRMPAEGECKSNYYVFSREPKWGWGYGGQVFHESLSMLAYAIIDPEGAMKSQRYYFARQRPNGYINYRTCPYLNYTIEFNGKPTTSAPWFNYENLGIYKVTGDKRFLAEAYTSGVKFYNYFIANRDSNHNGLCEWGGEASLESVRDARVAVWDKVGWPSNFEGPDLNSMLVMEARSLAEMASILGYKKEAGNWSADADKRSALINKYMWDTVSGFYYNINRDHQSFTYRKQDDLKIKEIIGFLPLWAGVSDPARTKSLVNTLKNPDEFWRTYGVPTLSAKDDYYNPMGYWNGPVWVQWDYLLFRGLLDHGYKAEATELAVRVIRNMILQLKNDHAFWEFYSPDEPIAGWNKTYIWAGIAARFLIDLER